MHELTVKENQKISATVTFCLVHTAQFGVGVLGYSRIVAKSAGYDGWISVIFAGICIHLIMWVIYKLLKTGQGNIIHIHHDLFGKWIGGLFNVFFIVYFFLGSVSILRTYIEIIQVWMFPGLPTWSLSIVLLLLCYYMIASGFRVITGIACISILMLIIVMVVLLFPLKYAHISNLLPVFNHSISDLLLAAKDSTYTMLGFETILMFYPFIQNAEKSQKYAQYGIAFSNVLFVTNILATFVFFSEEQLSQSIWSQLAMTSVISLPVIERLEYIVISLYAAIVLSSVVITLWAANRGIREVFGLKQKYSLWLLVILAFGLCQVLNERHLINKSISFLSNTYLLVVFGYIPILTLLYVWYKKRRARA
ncbi:GerAB/ArcD/ProY family transporter [Priestia taiwanensis]|uniref:Germination protein GerHB n=1 Tax=Priestia taiwanensis TaxID=1347902 RepID=A0A917AV96_9BACI|nr:GerAB/ArcD/ProY family transporter [Priestia taiwanensis]MBM7363330.1 spore germination protein (amino acid permease) [Priestia taiwanensis]GGE78055.1 germination protein GerHB [Priestia taiwanensis]